MKKFNFSLFLVITLSLLTIISCKKDKDDGISAGDGCSASWKVDGTSYSENDMALCVYLDNTLNLSASTTGGDFQLQIDPITTTGTYTADINNPDLTVFILITLNDGTQIGSANATINVTELSSSSAQGTFSGDFFDIQDVNQSADYSVTNGQFNSNF